MKLSIVATPIGNLEDITLRAIRTLREADLILAEDTRMAAKLLAHFDIKNKTVWRYDEHSHEKMLPKIIEALDSGKHIALTADAGTPGISDPGGRLVAALVHNFDDRLNCESIPGPSALTAAISISGFSMGEFVFLGFPPHKKGRETFFKKLASEKRAIVLYESPYRLIKALEQLRKYADAKRKIMVARELTKKFESIYRGNIVDILDKIPKDEVRGEFVIVISAAAE
ncbi:16S rRNA (cytidine(1402)-2'-O)-methyltransferase [Candidatus Uhrbacteria bacterium]|nr:16S rRNA (cytidine(1402)-2'-O)-methyltransferase [Candidatus Uhrbacteria bacterium]